MARRVGVANFTVAQMAEFGPTAVVQIPYSLLARDVERDILLHCAAAEVPVMDWSALAHGLLSGALRPGHSFAYDDWRAYSPGFQGDRFAVVMEVVDPARGLPRGSWPRRRPTRARLGAAPPSRCGVPVFDARNPEHVEDCLRALDVQLSDTDLAALDGSSRRPHR